MRYDPKGTLVFEPEVVRLLLRVKFGGAAGVTAFASVKFCRIYTLSQVVPLSLLGAHPPLS